MVTAQVLIVDDEEAVRSALRRSLRKSGHTFLFADSAPAALTALEQAQVDVVLSDHLMPGMTGLELLRQVRQVKPQAGRILLTGHADLETAMEAIRRGDIDRFLTKPWNDVELRVALEMAAGKAYAEGVNRRLLASLRAQGVAARGSRTGSEGPDT
jgi:two-component system, probable response regulator PhcQ